MKTPGRSEPSLRSEALAPWTDNISHGEALRAGYDETLVLDTCNLGFLYQGFDPASDGIDYNKLPWRLGLLGPR